MELSCMQLSVEGERLLKAGDYDGAIEHFEAGTNDLEVLSAIYNQLGNACFYVNKFNKALEYHKKDLEIAEKLNDRQGMAKAFGNLGNTFKSLKNYSNAIRCCEAHLEITRELGDRLGEGRACYNLGNVHHAVGKSKLARRDPMAQSEGRKAIQKAIEYYKATLAITAELKDTAGEGRAVGNLGNAYTAIGEYNEAIKYHERRLAIANQANDLAAKARACGNLGNAYSALGDYTEAIRFYRQSLAVAKEAGNKAGQGQAYYCLGSTYMLQKNYELAIKHHMEHLALANDLGDKQGQLKAYVNLRNAYHAQGNQEKTVYYHKLVQQNSQQAPPGVQPAPRLDTGASAGGSTAHSKPADKKKKKGGLFKKGQASNAVEAFTADDSSDDETVTTRKSGGVAASAAKAKGNAATEWLNAALEESKATHQDQPAPSPPEEVSATLPTDFFDMLAAANSRGLDDQRSEAPRAGMVGDFGSGNDLDKDEAFFDLLVAQQAARLDDQRAAPPTESAARNVEPQAQAGATARKTNLEQELDADTMSFFEMLAVAKKNRG